MPNTVKVVEIDHVREKLIDIVEAYADFLDWDTKEEMVDSIMEFLATDNNVGHKWIPVTERLPEIRERVLVYHDDGMIRFGINYGGFADVVSSIYLNNNHHTCFSKVTHWMPLPEPPKGE